MAYKAQPQDEALRQAVLDVHASRVKASGSLSTSDRVPNSGLQFCRVLTDDHDKELTLATLLAATSEDVDRFIGSLKPPARQGYRRALVLFFDCLVEQGHVKSSVMDGARVWPRVGPSPRGPRMSEERWAALLKVFDGSDGRLRGWSAAGYTMFLILMRNLGPSAARIGKITAGMARSGIIREENWRSGSVREIPIDPESARAMSNYLSALPMELDDKDQLLRQSQNFAPAVAKSVFADIRVRAARAGVPFKVSEIPERRLDWSADTPGAIDALFASFRRLHPRFGDGQERG